MKNLGDLKALVVHAEMIGFTDSTPVHVICHNADCGQMDERVPCTRIALISDDNSEWVDVHGESSC